MRSKSPGGPVRLGTRGSALARIQAEIVADALRSVGARVQIEILVTDGDRRAADTAWGEGAFVTAIEEALLDGRIDLAVHSAKDVPTDEDPRLTIGAFMARSDPRDVVVLPDGRRLERLDDLPFGARVGTDSPRRTAFLRAARPDLRVHPLHGNVDTRLRRLDDGETDALVLAAAGLMRLGREDRISLVLSPEVVPPAPGQGALAVQVRADDAATLGVVTRLDDAATRRAVLAERDVLAATGGGCRAPLGALGQVRDGRLSLVAGFARPDGSAAAVVSRAALPSAPDDPDDPGARGPQGDQRLIADLLDALASAAADAASSAGSPSVVVTRARDQAAATMLALVDRGFAPVSVPTIAVVPTPPEGLGAALAGRDPRWDWVVVTSANAVDALSAAAAAGGEGRTLAALFDAGGMAPRWAAVGRATERALRGAGITAAFRPARATGAALADSIPMVAGDRILLLRGDLADDSLPSRLEARGAAVDSVIAYRTIEAPPSSRPALAAAARSTPCAVVVTSGSTIRGWLGLIDDGSEAPGHDAAALASLRRLPVIAIGPETAREAVALGSTVVGQATSPAPAAIAEAVADAFSRDFARLQETR